MEKSGQAHGPAYSRIEKVSDTQWIHVLGLLNHRSDLDISEDTSKNSVSCW